MAEALQQIVSHVAPFLKGRDKAVSVGPQPLAIWPSDPWPAQANQGQWLLGSLLEYPAGFNAGVEAFWDDKNCAERHRFSWLGDLKAMGGDQARQSARILVASWLDRYGLKKVKSKSNVAFRDISVVSYRLINVVNAYDFHGATATDSYQSLVATLVTQDALHLYRKLSGRFTNVSGSKDYFIQSVAVLTAALCLAEDIPEWRECAEDCLIEALEIQILPDGGHISRSPQKLAEILKCCLDLRRLYMQCNRPFPEVAQGTIDRMAQAVKFFRYTDKHLAVFHGGQEYHGDILDLALHQVGQNKRIVKSLPHAGFERLTQGRSVLMVDVGQVPSAPFDRYAHMAPLAFELSHGKDRIVVNCGTDLCHEQWADALRRTSAHSTLILDHRDVMDLKDNGGITNRPSEIFSERREEDGGVLLEGVHDGYMVSHGMKHMRRLYMSDKGQDIRGEDNVYRDSACEKNVQGAIRFHLHPKVRVSLIREGHSALLRLYSGSGWRFEYAGARLSLEESVYMGGGRQGGVLQKTQQLLLSFDIAEGDAAAQIKWAFQREK